MKILNYDKDILSVNRRFLNNLISILILNGSFMTLYYF